METLIDSNKLKHSLSVMECLAAPHRFEIIRLLTARGEMNIREITRLANIDKTRATRHLDLMQKVGLINCRHKGKSMYYSLILPRMHMVMNIAEILAE